MEPRSVERGMIVSLTNICPLSVASMEPRSVERGMTRRERDGEADELASMEPRSVERGMFSGVGSNESGVSRLQWSRVRLNAEWKTRHSPLRQPFRASMEPRSVERGMANAVCGFPDGTVLQWSRVRLNAEWMKKVKTGSLNGQGFNGAAFG